MTVDFPKKHVGAGSKSKETTGMKLFVSSSKMSATPIVPLHHRPNFFYLHAMNLNLPSFGKVFTWNTIDFEVSKYMLPSPAPSTCSKFCLSGISVITEFTSVFLTPKPDLQQNRVGRRNS